jgi:hypothetical protein
MNNNFMIKFIKNIKTRLKDRSNMKGYVKELKNQHNGWGWWKVSNPIRTQPDFTIGLIKAIAEENRNNSSKI